MAQELKSVYARRVELLRTPNIPERAVAWVGRQAIAGARRIERLFVSTDHASAASDARSIVLRQVLLSGVRALPLVAVVATGTGAAMVLQTTMAPTPPSGEFGRMLVAVVLRELAPLLTTVLVAGHSGGVMACEFRPREALWPRIAGTMLAVWTLAIHFAAIAMLAGYAVSRSLTLRTFDAVRAGFVQELAWFDAPLFLLKTAGLGAIVGFAACRAARLSATREAVASRAFVGALLAGSGYSIGITVILYAFVGAPAPP